MTTAHSPASLHGRVALWHAFGRSAAAPVHAFVAELLAVVFEG